MFGTFLIIATPSVTELTQKFSFHTEKSITLIVAKEKQEYKNFSIWSPSILFLKDFWFFGQSLLQARFFYLFQLALTTGYFLSHSKPAIFTLYIFIWATAHFVSWFIGCFHFSPWKFKFFESQPLVQTLQDWSRTSWNPLESKDIKLNFALRLTVEEYTEVYINGLFFHSQKTKWKYNFWEFLNSAVTI